jgi:putative transposase
VIIINTVLEQFIQTTSEARELKRSLAIGMHQDNIDRKIICQTLQVSPSFISKWKKIYDEKGIDGIKLQHKGSNPKLKIEEKEEIKEYISTRDSWKMKEIVEYIKNKYNVFYKSQQSYYDILDDAGLSWKKTQKDNPKKDEDKVLERREWIKKN